MKARIDLLGALLALAATGAAGAQLLPAPSIPSLGNPLLPLGDAVAGLSQRAAQTLKAARIDRITALVRRHPDVVALDPQGFPARAGEVVLTAPEARAISAATDRGYRVIETGDLLGVGFVRLATPAGKSLRSAVRELRKLGAQNVAADQLHFEGGGVPATAASPPIAQASSGDGPRIGMIDGGVVGLAGQRGFAPGAPRASEHGTAVASLITGRAGVRGAAPNARLVAADVYGSDPAGGSATAIAKALAWLAGQGVSVVNVSLVGPANPLLARVVAAAQDRGMFIVAPVGNDGPASPPSYPASYPGVIAVTGVDGRNRVLIEAGRATHLDYAAPGADMVAASVAGRAVAVRGTSFAAPLVAGTLARAYPVRATDQRAAALATLDRNARRLGARYGRGLVCGECRTLPR